MTDIIYKVIGANVRKRRLQCGYTQEQLAATTSLGRTSIVNLEAGRQGIGTDLAKLQSEGRTLLAEVEDDGPYQLLTIRGAVDSEPK